MTADIDAVLSRLRERPECRDAVEVIEELRRRKATDDGAYEHVVGLYHAADEALRVAERDLAALTAERDRLREAIRWHRLAAEASMGASIDDPENYEPFDHALWAALGESPVPDEPTAVGALRFRFNEDGSCDSQVFAPSHPTGEERDR